MPVSAVFKYDVPRLKYQHVVEVRMSIWVHPNARVSLGTCQIVDLSKVTYLAFVL